MKRKSYKNALKLLGQNRQAIFYAFSLNILLLIPAAMSPVFKKVFTDYVLTDGVTEWLPLLLLVMVGTALFAAAATWLQKGCLLRLSNKIEISGAGRYFWALLNSPLSLFDKKDSYLLLSRAEGAKRVSKLLTRELLGFLFNIVSSVFYLIMMLRMDAPMAGVVAALALLNFGMIKAQEFIREKLSPEEDGPDPFELSLGDERIGLMGLENIETIKASSAETHFYQRLLGSKMNIINAQNAGDFEEACEPLEDIPEVIFLNLLLLVSALRIMSRGMTVGEYLAFQAYAAAFFLPALEALTEGGLFGKLEKRVKELFKELGGENESVRDEVEAPGKLKGAIEFKDVCFEYEKGVPVLQNISFSLMPGQRLAVLGNSGAGKTTLLKLLQGMYEPCSGEITIDGENPAKINRRLFANSIGCANQEITLFAASLRDNICMFDESVSDAELQSAARDACIHGHISSLEGAYRHPVAENGSNLSGGQRQRLEIARALLYDPSIVLFDEATGFIDPINRKAIEENLKRRGCSCVAATHVLTQLRDYDEIVVLEGGKIAGRGTHEELLRTSDFYASTLREEGVTAGV